MKTISTIKLNIWLTQWFPSKHPVFCRCSFEHVDIFYIVDFYQNDLITVDQLTSDSSY